MKHIANHLPEPMQMALTSEFCEKEHTNSYGYQIKYSLFKANKLKGYEAYGNQHICLQCIKEKEDKALHKRLEDEALLKEKNRRKNVLYYKSIFSDKTLAEAGFKTYIAKTPEEIANEKLVKQAVQHYKAKFINQEKSYFTTLLTGAAGVGKSHLAMAMLRNLNETLDVECVFINVRFMLQHIKDSFNNKTSSFTQMYFIDLLSRVHFLVLDDLGNESGDKEATNWVKEVLTEVLETRQSKATIITTNYTRAQLEQIYGNKMMDRSALISRLLRNTAPIIFKDTTDKRVQLFDLNAKVEGFR